MKNTRQDAIIFKTKVCKQNHFSCYFVLVSSACVCVCVCVRVRVCVCQYASMEKDFLNL